MTKTIYTVVTGKYDTVRPLKSKSRGFKHVILTDNPTLEVDGWETVYIKSNGNPLKQSRELKINVHKFIESDLYVYIDANYEIKKELNRYINKHFKGGYLAQKHPSRSNIYDEAKRIIQIKKDNPEIVGEQMTYYNKMGFRYNTLYENGFIIRDNSVNEMCEKWYKQVEEFSYRDQLSLPFINPNLPAIDSSVKNDFLELHPHKKDLHTPDVYYFQPMRGDKNLGKWYNKHCEIVPNDDDWICITDTDTMFLLPYHSKQIEDTIALHGDSFGLISCYTNRLGLSHQLPFGFINDPNILSHYKAAEKLYNENYSDVVNTNGKYTAGLFMLFKKSTWINLGGFKEGLASGDMFIDADFSTRVLKAGYNIGIMKGLFLLHFYRMNKKSNDISHLK